MAEGDWTIIVWRVGELDLESDIGARNRVCVPLVLAGLSRTAIQSPSFERASFTRLKSWPYSDSRLVLERKPSSISAIR